MKSSIEALREALRALRRRLGARMQGEGLAHKYAGAEPPLRSELFSADQMDRHGRTLAESHRLSRARGRDRLLDRLVENEGVLIGACSLLMAAVKENRRITPAGEWLLDNFYLIEEQIRTARRHFPKRYSRELPILANGPSAGLPRVYDIALEAIAHGDGRVDPESLNRFVAAYQKTGDLRLGELWAIPIMLRLALIENLRRVAARVAAGMLERSQAESWADQMMEVAEKDPKSLILVVADMARSNPPLGSSFVAELARRLQGQSAALALPLTWIEQRLSESGATIEQLVQSETQSQAANQVSISNSIGSLRFLSAMDWREFVETMSSVEHKLREDPDAVYAAMDFATRDRYRHVVERYARFSGLAEIEVARKAIQLAHQAKAGAHAGSRTAHVGYYLIDKGLPQLARATHARLPPIDILRDLCSRVPLAAYLGGIALLTAAFAALFAINARAAGLPTWLFALSCAAAALAASHLAVALVNWLVTLLADPAILPRLDFKRGIPADRRTLVVVPTMLSSVAAVDELAEALEVRFLANRDPNLQFALLTDLRDATEEVLPEDETLLALARARIEILNKKYGGSKDAGGDEGGGREEPFLLLHRPRRWNPQERLWMGYERKRGKLGDLNALLRGGARDAFSLIVGATQKLQQVKYVITLDTDTQLPRDSAREFVGTLAHPLNRAHYDDRRRIVTDGYSILQPRMAVNLPSTNRSRYAQLCASDSGIDPYTRAVSDVYQDLFHEGSFIGKGIYDVDAFERALKDRFPENRILSHDLLEGCHARAALMSDAQLFEDYPSRYGADVSRRHRWIRGDWQIAAWLSARVPGMNRTRVKNPLSLLSQWKIFDNLRRSLVPAALVGLLLLGWTTVPAFLQWTLAVAAVLFLPVIVTASLGLVRKEKEVLLDQHLAGASRSAARQFGQTAFALACLPYEAYYSLDAILRTAVRTHITHRHLLEWNPSSEIERKQRREPDPGGLGDFVRTWGAMWFAPALAASTAIYLAWNRPVVLAVAMPVLALWFAAPGFAWWLGRPLPREKARLHASQRTFLHRLARRTWAFFETFVTAGDHWLPPDNFQEHPVAVVAHRTSPTNIGLALLSNLAAYDFGYIHAGRLIERTGNTLGSMQALERYQGHFYNWYDTVLLTPLPPRYVSSVDSGNLAGHLLTLRPGLLAIADQPILGPRTFEGLGDTAGVLMEVAADAASPAFNQKVTEVRREIDSAEDSRPASAEAMRQWLVRLVDSIETLTDLHPASAPAADEPADETQRWTLALLSQCQEALDELDLMVPWAALAPESEAHGARNGEAPSFPGVPTLRQLSTLERASPEAEPSREGEPDALGALVALASRRARERLARIDALARLAAEFADFDYGFLYDESRHLFTVGYNVDHLRRDTGHYDLLASEARLSSFVAIAQGEVPQENWFALGRSLTAAGGHPVLLSWSGSMFEYLMPLLVMPTYEHTLLHQTGIAAVDRQIAYGRQRGVPWGMSESGYNAVDAALNYQYRAFGVPGLGLKRGLSEDLVIAPYASALALMVRPEEACENLQELARDGLLGAYGMYEAIDYTPGRVPRNQSSVIVRSFMAHHEGMSLLALACVLLEQPMQKRFESDPQFQATSLLLQERIPAATAFHIHTAELSDIRTASIGPEMPMRVVRQSDTPSPEVQLLSNGRYHVMVTNAGGGYSRWRDFAVTRWREDTTCDHWGTFCYIRDLGSKEFWSTAHQPTLKRADTYEAIFSEARAEFRRLDDDFETHTEIVVSPEDDIELRRIRITNRSRSRRTIDVTSYAEVVLALHAADALHPAFSNLFVQTEIVPERQTILCTRRPRSVDEPQPWLFHAMAVHGAPSREVSFETDRMRFVGRTRAVDSPLAMTDPGPLSGSQGSVLDPIVAIRHRVRLNAARSVTIDVVTGVGETREAALALAGKYRDRNLADRVFDLAWTHSWVILRQINSNEADAQLYGRLASSILYANPALRSDAAVLARNRRGQSGLWGYSISGDLPIVLLQIGDIANIDLVRQLVQAHAYWRLKGLAVDLVIWNEDHAGYRQLLQEQIIGLIAAGVEANQTDRPGGIFVRPTENMSLEDRTLFQTVARVIISDTRGPLAEQVSRRMPKEARESRIERLVPTRARRTEAEAVPVLPRSDLQFFNGFGGFSADAREYVITTTRDQVTPAPWVNVIANTKFGTVISESGAAYTWSENAHEFRFTPWGDDPVSDRGGEALYLRDEESGYFWSPAPLPCPGATPYITRHGFGYSVFQHVEEGIRSEVTVHVDTEESIKFSVIRIRNDSGRPRRLSVTGYVEWVLGDLRQKSAMHVVTEMEPSTGALCARNAYSAEYGDRVAYFDADDATRSLSVTVTGDRGEFLGRNGTLRDPAAMRRTKLSNRFGAGMDPCAAIHVPIDLAEDEEREIVFRLGSAGRRGIDDAAELVQRLRGPEGARASLEKTRLYWERTLGAVQVETPDASLNVLANGWLIYQTLACRLWARSGYYQSGGAYGFRDQLQDTMALIHAEPRLAREHLLRCAERQFSEGDVQHWWHPPSGRGVRTRCSDDFLWLPQAVCRYVANTGDAAVLNESAHFLEGRQVNPEDDSYFDLPVRSDAKATLYQHCVRAINRGLVFGERGLPLMGSGDWNDGMNLVGLHGKGESVWLGFFLYDTLMRFAGLAGLHGDAGFAERCRSHAEDLRRNLEQNAWDGGWYRRAYFDDGTPLGAAANVECQIDSIAQSWSVLSGAGDPARSRMAMDALDQRLVRRDHALIQLLDPPFDKSGLNPGYIKGYVPGVRENGGQYTHGAIWAAMAFAGLGDRERAWELFTMINPVNHGSSADAIATYKVEPYVVAADVYTVAPHTGRGGWTWYTGSAGWLYRLIVESLLGLRVEAGKLHFAPCVPREWESFKVRYRYRDTTYAITVRQSADARTQAAVTLDGTEQPGGVVHLLDDHAEHNVDVLIPGVAS